MQIGKSLIPWADYGASPVVGCRHKCPEQWGCYAQGMVHRWAKGKETGELHVLEEPVMRWSKHLDKYTEDAYPFGFDPTFFKYRLSIPSHRRPGRCFVAPMADMFGSWVPQAWIAQVVEAVEQDVRHDYLFLTKNPARYFDIDDWPEWAWLGATATTLKEAYDRVWFCGEAGGCALPWLSCEPWLGGDDLGNLMLQKEDAAWVVAGPLTGAKASKAPNVSREAVFALRDNCARMGVALFVKPSATAWGLTPEEVASMQAWPKPHPSERR